MKKLMLYEQFLGLGKKLEKDPRYKTDEIFYFIFRRKTQAGSSGGESLTIADKIGNNKAEELYDMMKNHQVGYDLFGEKLDKAPLKPGQTSWTFLFTKESKNEESFKQKYGFDLPAAWKSFMDKFLDNKTPLVDFMTNKLTPTNTLANYTPKNGWLKVWEDVAKESVVEEVVKNYDTKLFELGGFKMTDNLKNIVQKDIDDVISTSEIVEILIESSTDKTPLTSNLKNDLKGLNYSDNNEGLSKARAAQIKKIFLDNKIDQGKIQEVNLFEQGKSPVSEEERLELVRSKEGYDPSKRYVVVKFKVKKKPGQNDVYFQKIEIREKGKIYFGTDEVDSSGKCGYDK